MNRQPFGVPPRWWEPKLTPWLVRMSRGYRARQLRRLLVDDIEILGGEHVRQALDSGQGILICPNHSVHYDSAALYRAADSIDTPLYFMTAWQVFRMSSLRERWMMQRIGCFSVNREGNDRKALKQGIEILQNERCPLVIFPEGDVYHVSDYVRPFREGAAVMALAAARKADRDIVTIPCGIRFTYLDDPTSKLKLTVAELEDRLYLRGDEAMPLVNRILRISEAVIALKEIDYLGHTKSGTTRDRLQRLTDEVLSRLEAEYRQEAKSLSPPERVKQLRQHMISSFEKSREGEPSAESRREAGRIMQGMEGLFFVIQLYSYRGDYLLDNPSIERIAETVDKLEEDVLGRELPGIRGQRRAVIQFGEPIVVPSIKDGRTQAAELTSTIQHAVQQIVDGLRA